MRKEFLFLLLLFPLATMFKSSNALAADPPTSEYNAAMNAITDGAYYLVTKVGETKWYVTQNGYLTNNKENAYLFAISKDTGGALYDDGILIEPGNGAHFSNTTLGDDDKAVLNPTETGYCQNANYNRNDWERQVFYLNETGKFAIRSCNTAYGETSWADAGRVFWTYKSAGSDAITPCYTYDPAYIWTLELPVVTFEDNNVKAICVSNWDTDGDGELHVNEAAAVTDLGYAFMNNTSIISFNELQYFSGLTAIGANSFKGCSGLTSITIPASVTKTIGDEAFYGCGNLTSVTMKNFNPVTITSDVFTNRANATLTVPAGSREFYAAKDYWNEFRNIVQAEVEDIERPQYYVDQETGIKYTPINGTSGEFYSYEGFASACDGDINTKFGTSVMPNGIIIEASEPVSLKGYTIITANDNADVNCHGRNPKSWTLEGSNDLETWTVLDNQTDNMTMQDVNYTPFNFYLPAATDEYKYFRFTVTTTQVEGEFMQYSEIHLWQQGPTDGIDGIWYSFDKGNHTATVIQNNNGYVDKVVIPSSVVYGGEDYAVTGIADDAFKNCRIFTLVSETASPLPFGEGAFDGIPAGCILFVPVGTRDAYIAAGWTEEVFKGGVFEQGEMARRKVQELEVDNVTYSLYREVADWEDYRRDPDGRMLYSSKLTLEVTSGGEKETFLVNNNKIYVAAALEDIGGNEPMLIDMDSKQIFVFTHSKDEYDDYGFDGFAYVSPLNGISFQREVVFNRTNQGHYTNFINVLNDRVAVSHFRCAGYYAMVSIRSTDGNWTTINGGYVDMDTYVHKLWPQQQRLSITGKDYDAVNEEQYQAALEALPSDSQARIYTMYNTSEGDKKYYLTTDGTLTESIDDAGIFTFTQTAGDNFYASVGWKMNVPFSNPKLTDGSTGDILLQGAIQKHNEIRPDFEGKVFFKNGDKYAVRATNALSTLWGADTYWDVLDSDANGTPEADYSLTPNFVWQMEVIPSFEEDGLVYSIKSDLAVEVKGPKDINSYSGECAIPSTVTYDGKTYNVTSIRSSAFDGCTGLTSITIPSSIESIPELAFANCTDLASVSLPENLTSIGDWSFAGCHGLTSFTIPESVTYLGSGAFKDCFGLTSMVIPEGITEVRNSTFFQCYNLESVTIPEGVTSFGRVAFYYCSNLNSITLPETTETIGDYVFEGCVSLTSITIPAGVTHIGQSCFYTCENLTYVVSKIEQPFQFNNYAFKDISSNCTLYVPEGKKQAYIDAGWTEEVFGGGIYDNGEEPPTNAEIDGFLYRLQNGIATLIRNENGNYSGEIEIPATVTFNNKEYSVIRIDDEAFLYYSNITSVIISDGIKEIGERAFADCYQIASLTLPNTLTDIGEKAFFNCYNIPSITLPKGLERIGYEAFYNCHSIKSIEIPATVTEIGVNPFVNCGQLTTITVAEGNTTFTAQNGSLMKGSTLITGNRDLTIPTGVTKIGQKAFEGIWGVETYSIPEGIESIEDMAFQECGFSSVTFPSTVTEITGNPFAGCGDLISLEVDENNPTYRSEGNCVIKDDVLVFGCKKTVIPANVTIISEKAFYWCYDLSSIVIPSTISSIGEEAFSECYNLKSVFVQWENPVPITSESTFSSRYDATLYVPAGTAGNYQNAECWKDFSIKELHNDAECIDGIYYTLDSNTKTALVTYKTYGEPSYTGEVELESSIKVGGEEYAVVGIDNLAFVGCTELTSVSIPDGIVTISANAFYGCVGLSTLTLPISVSTIGNQAFYGCDNLASITVYWTGEESLPNISDQTFSRHNAVLNVPSGKTELYRDKDVWGWFNITDAIVVDGIYYSLDETNNTATVARNVSEGGYSGNIVIPATITVNNTVYDVTAIANEAFQWCDGLTSVTIPESVTSIGDCAFEGCWQASFKVNWDVPIAILANSFDEGATIYVPLGTADLYKNADNWKNLSINESHDGLEPIDGIYYVLHDDATNNVFTAEVTYGGTEYEGNVVIPSTITVEDVVYTVNSIGENAFKGCSKLTQVTIPTTITTFGKSAFYDCSNLGMVIVNWTDVNSIPVLADNVFNFSWPQPSLKVEKETADYYRNNDTYGRGWWNNFDVTDAAYYNGLFYDLYIEDSQYKASVIRNNSYRSLTEVVIPATITVENQEYKVTRIGNQVFYDCQNLTSVTIYEGIKEIGWDAFSWCTGLTTIQLPNSLTAIWGGAFYNCQNLTSVNIPEGATTIGNVAFLGTGLTEITIPSSVTSIEGNPFENCKALATIVVENGNTVYDSRNNCNAIVETASNTIITACKNTAIPTSIKHIGDNAYWGCLLTAINIPEGVESIGYHAFMDCSNLETVVIPSTVTSIGQRAFSGCDNLTSLNVKVVNPVELPLEEESYWHWDDNLQQDVEVIIYHEVFSDAAYANATLSVPAASIAAYNDADYWKKFNIVVLPNFFATNAEGITTSKLLSSGESVALLDTYKSIVVEMDIEDMNEISYTRTFNNTEWQALYLPFEMNYSNWSEDFEVARINDVHQFDDDDDGTIDRTLLEVIKLKDGSKTAANTPYVIKAKSVGEKTITVSNTKLYETVENVFSVSSWQTLYTFGTTYSTVSASVLSEPGYLVLGNGSLHPMNATSSDLSSFRWYLKVTDRDGNPKSQVNEVKLYVMGEDDDETNIGEISNSSNIQDAEVFDLSGRRLEKASGKGLYIINSKKVMVK